MLGYKHRLSRVMCQG